MRNVLIVVFDGVQSLDVTGPLEVFANAGGYRVETASLGGRAVRTTSGLRLVPDADLRDADASILDLLLVPAAAAPGAAMNRSSPGSGRRPRARPGSPPCAPERSCSPRRACSPAGT